ncbi:MAG: hypothetical protein H7343_23715 [Undibacterium sp.]|nr:hypothetical protein [Opitutaceae bacterium]
MAPHAAPVIPRWLFFYLSLTAAALAAATEDRFATVVIAPAKTSIYIGSVAMTMPTFQRAGARYESSYAAKVFPYFFYNERGTLVIDFTAEQLANLGKGERVEFKGQARSDTGENRRIEGHATPVDIESGKIKVRVFVSKKIELIFNTTYRFAPDAK